MYHTPNESKRPAGVDVRDRSTYAWTGEHDPWRAAGGASRVSYFSGTGHFVKVNVITALAEPPLGTCSSFLYGDII